MGNRLEKLAAKQAKAAKRAAEAGITLSFLDGADVDAVRGPSCFASACMLAADAAVVAALLPGLSVLTESAHSMELCFCGDSYILQGVDPVSCFNNIQACRPFDSQKHYAFLFEVVREFQSPLKSCRRGGWSGR